MNTISADASPPWLNGPYSIKRHGVTLTNCDIEPIRTPGCIQSHGVLLALRPRDLIILQVSENSAVWLGQTPAQLLGLSVATVIGAEHTEQLRQTLERDPVEHNPLYLFTLPPQHGDKALDVVVHTSGGTVILELEATGRDLPAQELDYYALLKKNVTRLQSANTLQEFCRQVTEEFRGLTGLDRVMVYRFHPDDHGEVFAECRRPDLPSWLGQHYPPEDVPKPARDIFMKIWIRPLPDAQAAPVELVPLANPDTGQPLDMTYCALRGASIMYTEYLNNMGVAASLTLPIQKDGRLWGLIACHHETSAYFSYQLRAACEFLAQVVSLQIKPVEDREQLSYRLKLETVHSQLIEKAARDGNLISLIEGETTLLSAIEAGGSALFYSGRWWCIGFTPTPAQLDALAQWLGERPELQSPNRAVYATEALGDVYPAGAAFSAIASGVLAISPSSTRKSFMLWFRPEIVQSINWAGNPHEKPTIIGPAGPRLTPRSSFELYTEAVRGHSQPWKAIEIEAALRLRSQMLEIIINQAEQLASLNEDLMRSNEELDTFAYVTSHDLKEPLRGISKYIHQLQESANLLDEENRQYLDSMKRLTQRMDSLLDSLLHFSRVGRVNLTLEAVDLNVLIEEALDMTAARREDVRTAITIPRTLPTVLCDWVRVREIFVNLISNALKYNDKTICKLEIGYWKPGEANPPREFGASPPKHVFYVRDNGIGIEPRHHEQIFKIFKRLHGRDAYGGGTGAGLAIVRMLLKRHLGEIWLDSEPGVGTTFYFTLGGTIK